MFPHKQGGGVVQQWRLLAFSSLAMGETCSSRAPVHCPPRRTSAPPPPYTLPPPSPLARAPPPARTHENAVSSLTGPSPSPASTRSAAVNNPAKQPRAAGVIRARGEEIRRVDEHTARPSWPSHDTWCLPSSPPLRTRAPSSFLACAVPRHSCARQKPRRTRGRPRRSRCRAGLRGFENTTPSSSRAGAMVPTILRRRACRPEVPPVLVVDIML